MFAEETVTSMYLIQLIFQIGLLIKIDFNILLVFQEGLKKKSGIGIFLAISTAWKTSSC